MQTQSRQNIVPGGVFPDGDFEIARIDLAARPAVGAAGLKNLRGLKSVTLLRLEAGQTVPRLTGLRIDDMLLRYVKLCAPAVL